MQNVPLPPRGRHFTSRRHRGRHILLTLLALFLVGGGLYGWHAWHTAQQTFSKTYHAVGKPSDTTITSGKPLPFFC